MEQSEELLTAINDMFSCNSLFEHCLCYKLNENVLKDCLFVVYNDEEGDDIPDYMQT